MSEKNKIIDSKHKDSVKSILNSFKTNIFGIEYYYNKFEGLAQGEDVDGKKRVVSYIAECFKEIGIDLATENKEKNEIKIPPEKVSELFRKLRKQPKILAANYDILSKSSFLMLNNYFEYLLSDLLAYHYNKFQKSLNEKFTLALKEINEFESIEEFTKSLITKEVESMMVELSFNDLLVHFQDTLEISNESEIIDWGKIIEARERRHLIVHNSSIVNKKYIARTNNPFGLKLGDKVEINKMYFLESCKEFLLAGLLISYNSWGKWDKETTTKAIEEIMKDSFELLKQHEFKLVSRFTLYLSKIDARTEDQEDFLMRAKFNRLISLKKLEQKDDLSKELKKIKIGTASPIFKLAHAVLSDKHDNIIDLIKQSKSVGELDIAKYREWPIYDFVKSNKELSTKIEAELDSTGANNTLPKAGRKSVKKVRSNK